MSCPPLAYVGKGGKDSRDTRSRVRRLSEHYVTMVKWATSTKVAINWLNRAQNISVLTLCEATTGVCTKVGSAFGRLWPPLPAAS